MRTAIVFLLLTLSLPCFAQQDSLASNRILSKFTRYERAHPREKVYLHLDRPYYAAGDTLYYKAYLTLPGSHKLSALSGVLHVELIDKLQGKTLFSEKLEVTNGVTWGDFALPDTLTGSHYEIRAYTNLMRNNGETDFFQQDIPVVTVKPKSTVASKSSAAGTTASATATALINNKPDLQFFPEGGTLVNGIRSKIAFKAINVNGLGIAVKGEVMDNDGKKICGFSSAHLGMGSFNLSPKQGKTYKAKVTYANGISDELALPIADNEGVELSAVNDSMLVIPVSINTSPGYFKANKGRKLILSIYSGGELTTIPCPLDSVTLQAYLYKKKLQSGITRLTLFSPDGEPLCERLLFINNNDQLQLTISTDKASYGEREKVTVKISAKDMKGLPVAGDFSVSVSDESKVPVDSDSESSIVNYLLLTSDLKGHIEQPNYYFNHQSAQMQSDLDNLMLTQGYRRFEWKAVMANTDTIPQYQPEKLLSIKGTVKTLSGKPVHNAPIALAAIKQLIARDTTTDANGNFNFDNLYITDTAKVLLRAGKGNKGLQTEVANEDGPLIKKLSPKDTAIITAATIVKPQVAAAMQKEYKQYGSMKNGIVLKQVNIHEDKNPGHLTPLLHSDNLNGPGRADQVIMGDQFIGCPTVSDCLAYLMHNAILAGGGRRIIIKNPLTLAPMAVLLNGIITDQSALENISPLDIYSIEVLESSFYLTIYGSKATGGLLVVTTRRGDERSNVNVQPGLTTFNFQGFYVARGFYTPKYDIKRSAQTIPDLRSTLFWKPVVLTDKDGNGIFDFYTSDHAANYYIQIEGIDVAGNLGQGGSVYNNRLISVR